MPSQSGNLPMSSLRRLDPAGNAPAIALAVAAGLHLAALPDHAGQGLAVTGFFLAAAAFQLTAAWVIALGSVGVKARQGIATGSLALIALWAWSRVAGLPVGTHEGPEAVSLLDGLAVAAEIIAVAGLCLGWGKARDRRTRVAPGAALLTVMVLTGAGAVRWLPANHTSHHEAGDQRAQIIHVTSPSEDDHIGSGVGVMPSPCPTGCAPHPSDGPSSHDDTAHAHP